MAFTQIPNRGDDKPVVVTSTQSTLDPAQFSGEEIYIFGSQPGGFKGNHHPQDKEKKRVEVGDENYLDSTLRFINKNVKDPSKVSVVIAGEITAMDYLVKYPKEASFVIYAFLKGCNLFLMSPPKEKNEYVQSDVIRLYLYKENNKFFYKIDNTIHYLQDEELVTKLSVLEFKNKKYHDDEIRIPILNAAEKQGHKTLSKIPKEKLERLNEEKEPEKHFAKLLADFCQPLALKNEQTLCAKHEKHLKDAADRKEEYKLPFEHEILGLSPTLASFKNYEEIKKFIQDLFDQNKKNFRTLLYDAAIDYLKGKGLIVTGKYPNCIYDIQKPSQIDKLINKILKPNFPFLKDMNWIKVLIESGVLYLLTEAPTFLLLKGAIVYPGDVIQKIFRVLLEMNKDLKYIQVDYEFNTSHNVVEKWKSVRSSSFELPKKLTSTTDTFTSSSSYIIQQTEETHENKKSEQSLSKEKQPEEKNKTVAFVTKSTNQPIMPKQQEHKYSENTTEDDRQLTSLSPEQIDVFTRYFARFLQQINRNNSTSIPSSNSTISRRPT